jgi:cell division protein FtsB
MKKMLASAALAVTLAAPTAVMAQTSAEFAELRRALEQVTQRLDALEQKNRALEARNTELDARNKSLEESNDKQSDQIAQISSRAKSADWATKISWKGDFRYRHEYVDPFEVVNDQTRHRIRARVGLTAKVNDTLSTTFQLATGGGTNDPRSTNQTLGEGMTRKQVAVDLAYFDWAPVPGLNVQLGKMPYPFQRVATPTWDPDLTPEGGAVKYAKGPFFGSVFGYWLSEASLTSDSNVFGTQLGLKGDLGGMKWTAAAMYYDLGAVQNEVTSIIAPSGMLPAVCPAGVLNNAFFNGAQGNTTFNAGDNCSRLQNDFNIWEVMAQAEFPLGSMPLTLYGNYSENTEAEDLNTAYGIGFTLGRASNPRTWELGYVYASIEKDGLFGQFMDSDFGGGITDTNGSVFRLIYAPARNWTINATYFRTERFVDVPITVGGVPITGADYDRYQIDFNVRY